MAIDAKTGKYVPDEISTPQAGGYINGVKQPGAEVPVPSRNDYVGQNGYGDAPGTSDTGRGPKLPTESDSQYRDRIANSDFGLANYDNTDEQSRSVTLAESKQLLKDYGLAGLSNIDFTGMNPQQAATLAQQKKNQILGAATIDGNTSSFYDVTRLNNIKKSTDYLMGNLNEVKNDPWSTAQDKTVKMKALVSNTTAELARMFNTPEDFIKAYQTNPAFTNAMKTYINAGGTVADVSSRIAAQDTRGKSQQTTAEYLAALKYKPGALDQAEASLTPERMSAQNEINRLDQIPQEYRDLYYGTPEAIGYFTKMKNEAQTTIDNLNTAYENSKNSTSQQFDIEIERQKAQASHDEADLEEKRLQSKNYLTGKLANIGALTTSGEAPKVLAELDARYDSAKTAVRTAFANNQATLLSKKTEAINTLDADLKDKIGKIESSVSKTEIEIEKEIQKAIDDSEVKKKAAIDKYNTTARTVYKQYLTEANKNAKDYVKEFYKTVSGGVSNKYIQSLGGTITTNKNTPKGKTYTSGSLKYTDSDIAEGESFLRSNAGADGYAAPEAYKKAYDAWVANKGLLKDFLAKYPPKTWVNPAANGSLPSILQNPTKVTSTNARSLK